MDWTHCEVISGERLEKTNIVSIRANKACLTKIILHYAP